MPRIFVSLIFFSVFILVTSQDETDDYWSDEYDKDKNCQDQKLIETLFEDKDTTRCVEATVREGFIYR